MRPAIVGQRRASVSFESEAVSSSAGFYSATAPCRSRRDSRPHVSAYTLSITQDRQVSNEFPILFCRTARRRKTRCPRSYGRYQLRTDASVS